ncbi:unnamed protein product [Mytilus edulis]|uniref:Ig-like domain-containing protein n=1 Tax=Mytilus edulis TaxID=6550 RepID=A0A8S3QV75_MYTED|nr:unnamed protein product [Mytilus edulis]
MLTEVTIPRLEFDILKRHVVMNFKNIIAASLEAYMSLGGSRKRTFCGTEANPEGIFVSFMLDANPFGAVPILKHWIFNAHVRMFAFFTTSPINIASANTTINLMKDIVNLENLVDKLGQILNNFVDNLEENLKNRTSSLIINFKNTLQTFKSKLNEMKGSLDIKKIIDLVTKTWKIYVKELKQTGQAIKDSVEFESNVVARNISDLIEHERKQIGRNIDLMITKLRNQIYALKSRRTGFGLRFSSSITLLGFNFPSMDIEFINSVNGFAQCSKFKKVYELLRDEESIKVLAGFTARTRLGYFINAESNSFISIAFNESSSNFVAHFHALLSVLGIELSKDVVIRNNGLYIFFEANIWNVFLAQVEISAEKGRKWYDLRYSVKGRLLAKTINGGSTADSNDFQGSYLDGLRQLSKKFGDKANERFQAAQNALSSAKSVLTNAQHKLSSAQERVKNCNSVFDAAVRSLETAKQKLERAKGPFLRAIEKLKKAQRNIDNLCKIKTCNKICVPGLRIKTCKKGWMRYPCVRKSGCLFKIPNPLCELANAGCRIVRVAAYIALEAAKLFVRVPLLAFDVAKTLVSVAQLVVDKSRVVLKIAAGVLEIAKLAIETLKGGLEVAKIALKGVKFIVGAALHVFDLIIKYGIQNIIDVRNCRFQYTLTTRDLPVFGISCAIQAFRLDVTDSDFNDKFGLEQNTSLIRLENKLNNRIVFFEENCVIFKKVFSFLNMATNELLEIAKDSVSSLNDLNDSRKFLVDIDSEITAENHTIEIFGINETYALKDYNLTAEDLEKILKNISVSNDPFLKELVNVMKFAKDLLQETLKEAASLSVLEYWQIGMKNLSQEYFFESECIGFRDCLNYSVAVLNDLFSDTIITNSYINREITLEVDNIFQHLLSNVSITVTDAYKSSIDILSKLQNLNASNVFCANPPNITTKLEDTTVLYGSEVRFNCKAIGDPELMIYWYHNQSLIGQNISEVSLVNVTKKNEGTYRCEAGNVVANVSSNEAFVQINGRLLTNFSASFLSFG